MVDSCGKAFVCRFCPQEFDNPSSIQVHEEEHMKMGDITVKAIIQSIKNEYYKVITESKHCKRCDQYQMIMCEYHTRLLKMLKDALKDD